MKKFKALIVLFWLLVWQLLAMRVDNPVLLATPLQAAEALAELAVTAGFWQITGISMLRIAGGFFLGCFLGLILAGFSSRSGLLEAMLEPVMNLFKTVPVASFAVLLLIWWGSSLLAVSICFLVVLPNIYIQTLEGLKSTDKNLLEMAEVFGMPFWNRFFYIYLPALKPFLYGSLKISLGMSWKSGVAAEVIGTPDFSIGERLYLSKIYLDTAGVFAWTAVIILASICFEKAVLGLAELFFRWHPPCRKPAVKSNRSCEPVVCTHLSKRYGELQVLKDFSAKYDPGRINYLRSPSGSGKTTLLRILCGLEQPDAGQVSRPDRCSMMFQEDRLCGEYSALKNVEMAVGDAAHAKEALLDLLEEEALYKPCQSLSGGMKRRVALVRAMEADAEVVLLDEPFTGMDADTRSRAQAYIRKKQAGRTVLIATHI